MTYFAFDGEETTATPATPAAPTSDAPASGDAAQQGGDQPAAA